MNLRYIERVFSLPIRSLEDPEILKLPETQALLKMLDCMPWLANVAEAKFHPDDVRRILLREIDKGEAENVNK